MKIATTHIVLEHIKPVMPKAPIIKVYRKVYELENGKYLIEREEQMIFSRRLQDTGTITLLSKEDFKEMGNNLREELA